MRDQRSARVRCVAFCGPIAKPGAPARGGYEAANRRTIDLLRQHGLDVIELAYPTATGSRSSKALTYLRGHANIARELLKRRGAYSLLHITPHFRQFILPEALICCLAWLLRRPVLLDIRAGALIHFYQNGSMLYRRCVDMLLHRAECIGIEGREYESFICERRAGPILYFPNFVLNKEITQSSTAPPSITARIKLVVIGRLIPQKGIENAISCAEILKRQGVNAELTVIGRGDSSYEAYLKVRASGLPVDWLGALPPDDVRRHIRGKHFFLFATSHIGEGHSNALTETMAQGVVPICSSNGFNESVVGDSGVILPMSASASDYAQTIIQILLEGSWARLSAHAQTRVHENFSCQTILTSLISQYNRMIEGTPEDVRDQNIFA